MIERGRIRFGIFDFDRTTRELRRDGVAVRLQAQPAHVLALLLDQAGDVVTREALREAVWGTDTFVDFDRGLNFCVAQIRAALGDSAESPRFVKTLPKRGYQFIAPVGSVAIKAPAQVHVPKSRIPAIALLGLLAAGVVLFAVLQWNAARTAPPPTPVRIAVARFDNQTDRPDFESFAEGLSDAVVAELTQAGLGRYDVIGNAAILRQPRGKRDLLAIASSLKVGYIILGQVQRTAAGVHVLAHLIRLPAQTHISVVRLDSGIADTPQSEAELAQRIVGAFAPKLVAVQNPPHRAL
jgi:DNA-binding winged helix-turn-helix (wHTH) protein/TolB-like protein